MPLCRRVITKRPALLAARPIVHHRDIPAKRRRKSRKCTLTSVSGQRMMWLYPGAPRQKEALFMTLQQLAYLVAVAECGSITDAAERLFISQPSLSAAIHNLEKEMGVTAFVRSN